MLAIAIVLGGFIGRIGGNLFVYIQTLYAFFAPPFSAVFLLGILWKRINAKGAITAVFFGFLFGIAMKVYVQFDAAIQETLPVAPSASRSGSNRTPTRRRSIGLFAPSSASRSACSRPRPGPSRVTDQLTFNWRKMNIFGNLGNHWYTSVVTWWILFVLSIVVLLILFSGFVIPTA